MFHPFPPASPPRQPRLDRFKVWLVVGAAALCLSTQAQAASPAPVLASDTTAVAQAPRPKIGLVLSGGGARGFAHVGVLKALEEARVPVDFIVGTSMGAIIGGLYASGMNADELERELVSVDWGDLFDRREPRQLLSQRRKEEDFEFAPMLQMGFRDGEFRLPTGAVSSRSLEMLLRRYTLTTRHLATFNGLPTPFRAVATDMETGKAVVMEHGDLAAALRASMSVPGVFSPLEVDGQILGDGGLVNNLPVDVARRMGADIIIAVNIGTPLAGRETLGTVLGVTAQMVNILTEQNVQVSLAQLTPKDLLLTPDLGNHTSADFDKALELVEIGHAYADAERESLRRYAAPEQAYSTWQTQRIAQTLANSARVGSLKQVQFEGVSVERAERLRQVLDMPLNQPVSVKQIENDMQELAATGDYERVDYRLENQGAQGTEALVVSLRENDWGPNYLRIGMDLQTDFEGRSAFNLRLSHNRHWLDESGAEWRNRVQLGETVGLYSEFYQPWGSRGQGFAAAYLDANLKRLELYNLDGDLAAIGRRQTVQVGADLGLPLDRLGRFGDLRLGTFANARRAVPELVSADLVDEGVTVTAESWREIGLRARVTSDQLDYANFPSSGYRTDAELAVGRLYNNGKSNQFTRLNATATGVRSWGPHTLNASVRVGMASDIPVGAIDEYSLGGFQQLSGYRVGQVAGNYLTFGRLTYYQRLAWRGGVVRALFAGGSLELGNAWADRSDMSLSDLRVGSSLFVGTDTGLGPLYLSVVHAPKGYTGLYLFLGRP
ncbi:patatin-like phospholipase family protein [Hydrogenophaga sp. PAMC20947]|uniref:patatin-like phospholipase family protein n=1 Tax=Hydrogenophaga sp. PAMC20947 TaxID=2565558 RepID=UPI001447C2F3|nr:patatin-like phospholipase family protein [Hydrogenophaga sp. PAMC20947]